MKRNIDLTADFDFAETPIRSARLSSISILSGILKRNGNIVDIPYCIQNDIEHKENGGIIQGDKSRREFIQMVACEIHCECCGRPQNYPWEEFCGFLCPQCGERMERDFAQFPWNRA